MSYSEVTGFTCVHVLYFACRCVCSLLLHVKNLSHLCQYYNVRSDDLTHPIGEGTNIRYSSTRIIYQV